MRAKLVPHTGIAVNVRRVPTEYGCYGGFPPAPAGSGRLEGTDEGTNSAPTSTYVGDTWNDRFSSVWNGYP